MEKNFKFIIYKYAGEETTVNAVVKDETVWLTQKSLAELFDVNVPAISKHLQNIFDEGELDKDATVSKMEIVQQEGTRDVKRTVEFYNSNKKLRCHRPRADYSDKKIKMLKVMNP